MPELTVADVAAYTDNRLAADDEQTARLLAVGLSAARRWCGWHVTPVVTESVTVDGTGSSLLVLPTLRLLELTSLIEDGIEADVTTLSWGVRGLVRKKIGYGGGDYGFGNCWTLGCIDVTITHGFLNAPEWQSAVLSFIDRTSFVIAGGMRETVGPFTFTETPAAAGSVFTDAEKMLLDMYRLEPAAS